MTHRGKPRPLRDLIRSLAITARTHWKDKQ